MYTIDNLPESINIGKQGESGILTLEFDCAAWLAKYPGGVITAVYVDPLTNALAPIPLTQAYKTGNIFHIEVLRNLTVYAGYAYINIRIVDGVDIEKRSAMIKVCVEKSIASSDVMPPMVQDWINDATSKLDEVDHFVDDAHYAATAANAAALRAENGEDDREQAEGLRVIAEQGRHDAYGLAEATRDGLYSASELLREDKYSLSEIERNNLYEDAESDRNVAYSTAEDSRNEQSLIATLAANAAALRAENGEDEREAAESIRLSSEAGRNGLYALAESNRDDLYDSAESARDGLFSSAELIRNNESSAAAQSAYDATGQAEIMTGIIQSLIPKWTSARVSSSGLAEGASPTASITQDETGTSISLGIPKGDTGAKGDKGNDGKPFTYRGDYNAGADPLYSKNDVVRFGGGSFVYINDVDSNEPTSSTSHWQQIASQGLKGDTGAKIVSGEYVGTDLVFTLDDATTVTVADMKAVPDTWLEFQAAVRDGTIDQYFAAGDQFNVIKGATSLVFDIVDIGSSTRNVTANGNAPKDPNYFANFPNAKPVTLLMHDVINGVMFDNGEANYQITTLIPSGTQCNITLESDTIASATYDFTAPSNLVVGGRLRISNATTLHYYASPYTAAPTAITMAAGSSYGPISASLSVQNHKQRVSYGSNKYTESAIRQWLNAGGAAGSFWTSKSNYDLAPSWHSTLAGFRNGLDPDLLAVLGETTREVELNTVTDGGGQATIADNIFLPSRMEIYGSVETAGHKGLQFQAYVGLPDIDKIKYDTTALSTTRLWWIRSPLAGSAGNARYVHSITGSFGTSGASGGYGAAAACVIL